MKQALLILLLFFASRLLGQGGTASFGRIDARVAGIDPAPPAQLARELSAGCNSDLEKVRAVFSWIAQHVEYHLPSRFPARKRTGLPRASLPEPPGPEPALSANDIVAQNTLNSLSAYCEGYSRLFKILCDQMGIPAVLITGYGRGGLSRAGSRFGSNHFWNAVYLDNRWQLLDVTWASGYISYRGDEFIRHFEEDYFLTAPARFIEDHFPDDLSWTLLKEAPSLPEFRGTPFYERTFRKYHLVSFSPAGGTIEASAGDSIRISLQTSDAGADHRIATDTLLAFDPARADSGNSNILFARPQPAADGRNLQVAVAIGDSNKQWLQVVYNNDIILCYRLHLKKDRPSLARSR